MDALNSLCRSECGKNRKGTQPQCFSKPSVAIRHATELTCPVLIPVTFQQQTEGGVEVDQLLGINTQARASPIAVAFSSDLPNEIDLLPLTAPVPVEKIAA